MVILFQLLFRVRGGAQIWTNAQRNWRRRYSTRKSTSGDKRKPAQAFSSKLFFFVCNTFFYCLMERVMLIALASIERAREPTSNGVNIVASSR